MHKNVTPLKVWIGVISIFFITQILIYINIESDKKTSQLASTFDMLYKEMEESFNSADSSVIKIAVIGTSLTGHGISCSDDIRDYAQRNYGVNIELRKIFFLSDNFRYFVEKRELLKKLIQLDVDIIMIQTEALAVQLDYQSKKSQLPLNIIRILSQKNREFIQIGEKAQNEKNSYLEECYPRSAFELPSTIDTLFDIKAKPRNIKSEKEVAFSFEDLKACKENGIQVIMLDFPRPYKVEQMARTPFFNKSLEKLAQEYQEEFGIEHWTFDETMYFNQFRDYAHLNATGREVFTTWLVDEIVKEKSR